MQRIAKFHKVSEEQFLKDWADTFPESSREDTLKVYQAVKLPRRATAGSAGYDFFAPVKISLASGETVKIPTGIRAEMEAGWDILTGRIMR